MYSIQESAANVRIAWVDENNASYARAAILIIGALFACLNDSRLSSTGAVIVAIVAFDCYWRSLGRSVGIVEFAALISVIQWLLAPVLAYGVFPTPFDKYRMYVDEVTYFSYAIPATAVFIGGLFLASGARKKARRQQAVIPSDVLLTWAFMFLLVGLTGHLASRVFPGSFAFVFLILANMKFAAMLMFYFSKWRHRWWFVLPLAGLVILSARSSGMFHGLILWGGLGVFYFFLKHPRSPATKALIISFGLVAILSIQVVKRQYRDYVWRGDQTSFARLLYQETVDEGAFTDEGTLRTAVSRFNQGWVVSRIMAHVPMMLPYQGGKTFLRAAEAALLPRLFNKDKAVAGGRENFQLLTGLRLNQKTSMGVSLLGECYGNFGGLGGILAMFVLGFGFGSAVRIAKRAMAANPIIFFVLPVIFLDAVKAETDLVTILNYIVKSGLLCLGIAYIAARLNIPSNRGRDRRPKGFRLSGGLPS